MIFDTHAHLICADRDSYPPNPLRGELSPGEFDDPMTVEKLVGLMDAYGVSKACAVQRAHVYGYDNRYILDSVDRFPDRLRAVVVLNPLDPETPSKLKSLAQGYGISGVRFGAPSFPISSLEWIEAEQVGIAWQVATDLGLPICIHVLHVQREQVLPALLSRIASIPAARVVVDHVGGAHAAVIEQRWLESQGHSPGPEYSDDMLRLADHRNVVVKFSDINLEGSPDPSAFVLRIAGIFGADRMIWGSDIGQSRGDYGHMVQLARQAVSLLSAADQSALLHDTAAALYD